MAYKDDEPHFAAQEKAVFNVMKDGKWRTPNQIWYETGIANSTSADTARRNLRKRGYIVRKRTAANPSNGKYEYKLDLDGTDDWLEEEIKKGEELVKRHASHFK